MFCQSKRDDHLHDVQSFNTSTTIIERAPYDPRLCIALAGVSDLIAAEGRYHLKCYSKFKCESSGAQESADKNELALNWLCSQLKNWLNKGIFLS